MNADVTREVRRLLDEARFKLLEHLKNPDLRLNLMVPEDGRLSIVASSGDMSDLEKTLRLGEGEGCAGKAWKGRLDIIADLNKTKDPAKDWNIPESEAVKVKTTLKSILSIPVYAPDSYDSVLREGKVIGVLNVDSEDAITESFPPLSSTILLNYINLLSQLISEADNVRA
jgi:hypothetical protein